MKKLFFASFAFAISITCATHAATLNWWQQPTICKLSTTNCYVSMGAGYDAGMWDATGNCRGMKLICPNALTDGADEPKPMGKSDLAKGTGISTDFDTSVLADGCFGARKTSANGTQASVGGNFVNVYCRGVLDDYDEIVTTGEIKTGTQPTCAELAEREYVAVVNGRCYGKRYAARDYYIECGSALLPTRMIVLNGAHYESGTSSDIPENQTDANKKFELMYKTSQEQHKKYFQPTAE